MSTPPEPTEEELRAFEEQMKRVRVEDVVLQTAVSLLNLGGRKAGLAPGTEDERDLDQVRMAIDGATALLKLVEDQLGPDAAQLKQAVSQLQMAYVKLGGEAAGAAPAEPAAGGEAPAQEQPQDSAVQSGRLWVPGQ